MEPVPCKTGYDHVFNPNGTVCVLCYYNSNPKYSPEVEKAIRKHKRRRASRISLYKRVIINWGDKCVFCGDYADTGDHLIPRSRGGSSRLDNLRPACADCNQSKADLTPFEWYDSRGIAEKCPKEFRHLVAPLPRRCERESEGNDKERESFPSEQPEKEIKHEGHQDSVPGVPDLRDQPQEGHLLPRTAGRRRHVGG